MQGYVYHKDTPVEEIIFPDAALRKIGHVVRNVVPIPGYQAVVDRSTNYTYAIVKDGYKLLRHEEVINALDTLCEEFPEYGVPTKEIWLSNFGGRMRTRYTFKGIDLEIGKLRDGSPDTVHPTLETMCSYDTSLAQLTEIGGYRLICTNGMRIGKILASYKRKHTASLDLEIAKNVLTQGMEGYAEAAGLWFSYAQRLATLDEINAFESIGFQAHEKIEVESEIKRLGNVIKWDDNDMDECKVEINAWDLYNIYTAEATHNIKDITRQHKVQGNIAEVFN